MVEKSTESISLQDLDKLIEKAHKGIILPLEDVTKLCEMVSHFRLSV